MAADVSEVQEIVVRGSDVVVLMIDYEDGDSGAAVGSVCLEPLKRSDRGDEPVPLLWSNDTLRTLWASPGGSLWVASADGNIGTTAKVKWSAPDNKDLDYENARGTAKWTVTSLPKLKSNRKPPNVTALWGTSDFDVHVGTYGGHLYHWDGKFWTQTYEGPGRSRATIRAIGGIPNSVFAVGAHSTLLHFRNDSWIPMRLPTPEDENIAMSAIRPLTNQQLLFCGTGDEEGILFRGNAQGVVEMLRTPLQLEDMAGSGDRTLFATDRGAAELFEREIRVIRDTFEAVGISAGEGRWFFIDPDQETPNFIDYDPAAKDQWIRRTY